MLAGNEPSLLDGAVSVLAPLAADGSINLGVDSLTGDVTGQRVPSALMQPFLAGTPVLLSRDLGDLVDVSAKFSPGEQKDIELSLTADQARIAFTDPEQQRLHAAVVHDVYGPSTHYSDDLGANWHQAEHVPEFPRASLSKRPLGTPEEVREEETALATQEKIIKVWTITPGRES